MPCDYWEWRTDEKIALLLRPDARIKFPP